MLNINKRNLRTVIRRAKSEVFKRSKDKDLVRDLDIIRKARGGKNTTLDLKADLCFLMGFRSAMLYLEKEDKRHQDKRHQKVAERLFGGRKNSYLPNTPERRV